MDQQHSDPRCEIYQAWEEHSFNLPPERRRSHPDSSVAVWTSLWSRYASCGRDELAIEDLSLLCHWGWTLAIDRGDCELAIERLAPWFSREDSSEDDGPNWAELHGCAVETYLRAAEPDLAAETVRVALSHEQARHRRMSALVIRHTLLRFGATQPESAAAPHGIAVVVRDVLATLAPGQHLQIGSPSPCWEDLVRALASSFPPDAEDPSA